MASMKERAEETVEATHQIVASSTVGVLVSVAGQLPSVQNMKRTIQRTRQREQTPLANPTNLNDLILPQEYTQTLAGVPFLLHDSGAGNDRILLFSTQRNLDLMAQCTHWFADGTFKTSPPLFSQVYTIHALIYNDIIPTIFVLMPNRTESTYNRVFSALKSLKLNLQPTTIMTDFERSSMNAFHSAFPNAIQRGCFFHLSQSIWRRIQQTEGLKDKYTDDSDFALQVRHLASLAFVPVDDVVGAFEELIDSPYFRENSPKLQPIVDYFEDTWIGRPLRQNHRRNPCFAHSLWNCYDATKADLPKTNNSVEGWHYGFNQLLGAHHPTIWKFINGLQKEQSLNELKVEQYIAGQRPPAGKRIYRDTAEKIKEIVEDYGQRPLFDYLKGIAQNFNLQI
jgi:hypothetical protein